jgi:hypothetical protein
VGAYKIDWSFFSPIMANIQEANKITAIKTGLSKQKTNWK